MGRIVCWFSCGAASAVAASIVARSGKDFIVVYCDTMATEHPDNQRFFDDVQRWIGADILRIKSNRYTDVDDVIEKRKYLAGRQGAPCTIEMKKRPRFEFQRPDDVHVFGMTKDENKRAMKFAEDNPELILWWPLIDDGITKQRCLEIIADAGIELPMMYRLGYRNNNCLGCVKATSPAYWNAIRRDFPDVFQRRCEQSRKFGARIVRVAGQRVFLDELPVADVEEIDEDLSCGPQCVGIGVHSDGDSTSLAGVANGAT